MYYGRYGNLPTVDAAQKSLQEIAANCTWDDLNRKDYAANRLERVIYGIQMVIHMNGKTLPVTWLPLLYRPDPIEGVAVSAAIDQKMITYANRDD